MAASSRWGRARRAASAIGPGLVVALVIGWICATRGGEILAALAACPPWVIAGATSAHLLTLALRTEAWLVLFSMGAIGLLRSGWARGRRRRWRRLARPTSRRQPRREWW